MVKPNKFRNDAAKTAPTDRLLCIRTLSSSADVDDIARSVGIVTYLFEFLLLLLFDDDIIKLLPCRDDGVGLTSSPETNGRKKIIQ